MSARHLVNTDSTQTLQRAFLMNDIFGNWQSEESALLNHYEEIWEESVSQARDVFISIVRDNQKSSSNLPD